MVSVVIIVRGGGAYLDGCLDSLSDAPEVIVWENGPPSAHRKRGNEVLVRGWANEMGLMRNLAKERASGDTIFSMDADERLEGDFPWDFRGIGGVEVRGWTAGIGGKGYWRKRLLRVFPKSVNWVGGIHEYPEIEGIITSLPVVISNVGYDMGHEEWEKKFREYEERVLRELERRDSYLHYRQLAKSLKMRGIESPFINEQIRRLHEQDEIRRAKGFAEGNAIKW